MFNIYKTNLQRTILDILLFKEKKMVVIEYSMGSIERFRVLFDLKMVIKPFGRKVFLPFSTYSKKKERWKFRENEVVFQCSLNIQTDITKIFITFGLSINKLPMMISDSVSAWDLLSMCMHYRSNSFTLYFS